MTLLLRREQASRHGRTEQGLRVSESPMMHSILLSLALAIQGPSHAELHPADADVYLEVANASAALTQLDGAPLLKLLRDARLKPLFDQLGQSPERPLKDLLKMGLTMA